MYCPQRSNRSRASWPSEAHAHSSLLMGAGARGAVFSGIVAEVLRNDVEDGEAEEEEDVCESVLR